RLLALDDLSAAQAPLAHDRLDKRYAHKLSPTLVHQAERSAQIVGATRVVQRAEAVQIDRGDQHRAQSAVDVTQRATHRQQPYPLGRFDRRGNMQTGMEVWRIVRAH